MEQQDKYVSNKISRDGNNEQETNINAGKIELQEAVARRGNQDS